MTTINATALDYQVLNEQLRSESGEIIINNCLGQRFIGAGQSKKSIIINGTPGNALGAYLNGATVIVHGNGQDAVGDTMNEGKIIIHGSSGDAAGYAMRGGEIYIHGNAGYRAGIHMKAYNDKVPAMIIGGACGSFLGEYQAGGIIIVLALGIDKKQLPVGNFCGTGMHGGKIYIRCTAGTLRLPPQVKADAATKEELAYIEKYIDSFCEYFNEDKKSILNSDFCVLTPNSSNPYTQMYVKN